MMRRREFIALLGGAVVAWPPGVLAQVPTRRPLVAVLTGQSSASASHSVRGFTERIQELGYIVGRDIDIVNRYADGDMARVPALVDELVGLKPDVMLAANTQVAIAMRQATASVPIVAANFVDPVGLGLVASHARPGGNVTGILVSVDTLPGKQLAVAAEAIRDVVTMGLLFNPGFLGTVIQRQGAERAAAALAIKLVPVEVRIPDDLDAADFVHKILKGAKPADLPVELTTKFQLVVNLKTAKAIGRTIAESFLVRADEVIE